MICLNVIFILVLYFPCCIWGQAKVDKVELILSNIYEEIAKHHSLQQDKIDKSNIVQITPIKIFCSDSKNEILLVSYTIESSTVNILPNNMVGEYIILLNVNSMNCKIVFLKFISINSCKVGKFENIIVGIKKEGYVGRLQVFEIIDNELIERFCSKELVFNSGVDCESYENFQLMIEVKDINSDNIIDIRCWGKKNYYCEGKEKGFGRLDKPPIRTESIEYIYKGRISKGIFTLKKIIH